MTRRERHERIIRFHDEALRSLLTREYVGQRGLRVLSDDAVEELARAHIADRRISDAINARNRRISAQKEERAG